MMSKPMPVEPHCGTMIHAIEGDGQTTGFDRCRQDEVLDIYALSTGKITGRTTHLRVKRQLYAPIMWHRY